ncbi:hypothetical protein A3F65_02780 [Candidatus Saccharibacteria bacterium RIFCSPHIGHO2_12_FULL_47_16b]|nr:MAG: hypothetical protein A3F65_02780 [Candidatus Saccharibacteria bacterium RIFCSPHIGHO2_12_FULL_47_16b]
MVNQVEQKFLRSWQGEVVQLLIFAILAYALISLALDSARTIAYIAGIVFLVLAIKNLIRLIKRFVLGKR